MLSKSTIIFRLLLGLSSASDQSSTSCNSFLILVSYLDFLCFFPYSYNLSRNILPICSAFSIVSLFLNFPFCLSYSILCLYFFTYLRPFNFFTSNCVFETKVYILLLLSCWIVIFWFPSKWFLFLYYHLLTHFNNFFRLYVFFSQKQLPANENAVLFLLFNFLS